jgi:hypothetical protein
MAQVKLWQAGDYIGSTDPAVMEVHRVLGCAQPSNLVICQAVPLKAVGNHVMLQSVYARNVGEAAGLHSNKAALLTNRTDQ